MLQVDRVKLLQGHNVEYNTIKYCVQYMYCKGHLMLSGLTPLLMISSSGSYIGGKQKLFRIPYNQSDIIENSIIRIPYNKNYYI